MNEEEYLMLMALKKRAKEKIGHNGTTIGSIIRDLIAQEYERIKDLPPATCDRSARLMMIKPNRWW